MNKWLRSLLFASSVTALAACGGGGGGSDSNDPIDTPQTVSMSLSGVVYDEELANAEVAVYVGTSTTPVGTGSSDANGNYTLDISVSADDLNQACVIRAVRGDFSLATLPGTVQSVSDAAVGGAVSGDSLPGVNVTNVSTAQLAVIKSLNGGSIPNDQTSIDQLEATIEANANGEQDDVLQVAAAIKAVIDSGAALPSASTDTEDLADDILAASQDPSVTTFLTDNADAINTATSAITSDPILASQLIVAGLTSADIEGNSYTVGEDTLLVMGTGTMTVYDIDTISATGDAGTWSLNADTQVLTMSLDNGDGTSSEVTATITGGTANAIVADVVVDGTSQGTLTLRKVVAADTLALPLIGFDINYDRALELPATCTGTEEAIAHNTQSDMSLSCNIVNGVFVLTPTDVGGVAVSGLPPVVVIPLSGTDIAGNIMNYAMWEYELDSTSGLPAQDPTTSYSRARLPIDKALPAADSVSLRLEADGTPSIRVANSRTSVTIHKFDLVQDTKKTINKTLALMPSTDATNPFDFDLLTSTNDNTGALNYVVELPGGTIDPTTQEKVIGYGAYIRDADGSSHTRIQYAMAPITAAEVSGKTFAAEDLVWGEQVSIAFYADGTGLFTDLTTGDTGDLQWSIGTSGTLEVEGYDPATGDLINVFTMYKGKVDLGAGSMILAGYAADDILAWVVNEQ
jgi:hypothetical protein